MPRLFISHSSRQNAEALALSGWLTEQGLADHFLDLDKIHPGQDWKQAFERSASVCEAVLVLLSPDWLASRWCLREAALALRHGSRVFPIVVRPVPQVPRRLAPMQWCDLTTHDGERRRFAPRHSKLEGGTADVDWPEAGLESLLGGLLEANLIGESFAWPPAGDPERSPYPGLRALDEADAAVFFGRRAILQNMLEHADDLAGAEGLSIICLLGASGSGKSSFLRAGVLPRLRRRSLRLAVMSPLRVGPRALEGALPLPATPAAAPTATRALSAAIAAASSAARSAIPLAAPSPTSATTALAAPSATSQGTPFAPASASSATTALAAPSALSAASPFAPPSTASPTIPLEVPFAAPSGAPQPAPWQSAESDPKALGAAIRAWEASLRAARAGERSIVVPLDQGEELFAPAAQHDAPRLVEQLRAIPGPVLLVMAMRSEHFAALQQQPWFNERPPSRKKVLGLEAMPQAEYRDVIEGPARVHSERTRQRIEPEAELVDALVEAHAQGQDALPMLALTLETLYRPLRREPVAHLTTAAFEALLRDGTVVQRVLEQAWADPAAPPSIPADDKARTPHLEKLFALLAGFSAVAAQPVRRVASAEAIRALGTPAQALAERLIERRLLTRYGRVRSPAAGDGAAAPTLDGQYVEIAHEAVLRTWPLMAAWLDRRRVDLTLADEVEGAARRWIAEGRRPAWLTLWGSRLPRAERLIRDPDLAARFDADVRGFVRRCRRRVWSRRAGWIVPVVSIVTAASAGAVVWRERANGFPATRHALLAPLWWHIPATRHEPRFVPLLPGRFVEGCVPGRDDTAGAACEPNDPPEEPARDVAFACELQAHEVTVEQYDRFVFKTRPRPYPPIPEGWTGGYPVVNVSVADAQAFARWLCTSGDGGHDYRLPTAAEWEYGARGGATGNADAGPYPWGHSAIADLAPEQRLAPKPVASLEAWGKLYGMSGNVWEWVTGSEPRYPYELRGGAFNATPDRLRIVASMREAKDTANVREGNADSGFRLCRVPKQKEQPCASE